MLGCLVIIGGRSREHYFEHECEPRRTRSNGNVHETADRLAKRLKHAKLATSSALANAFIVPGVIWISVKIPMRKAVPFSSEKSTRASVEKI